MTFHFHPDNESTSLPKLLRQAIDEVVAMTDRHFRHDTVLRATIPARGVDTDVLLIDALHRALDFYEQTDKEGIDD